MNRPTQDDRDPYSRVQYRKVVAWPKRIEREAPFLLRAASNRPPGLLLDLGCATGEHSRFFAAQGFRVVGLDRSAAMVAQAAEAYGESNLLFLQSDLRALPLAAGQVSFAICLGNTLVHLTSEADLVNLAAGLGRVLTHGGAALLQILNYRRLFECRARHLPLNFVEDEGGETVFLRLMTLLPEGRVRFYPTTLRIVAGADPAVQVVSSREVDLRGWQLADLRPIFAAAGLGVTEVLGDMVGGTYEPLESPDLVLLLEKESS